MTGWPTAPAIIILEGSHPGGEIPCGTVAVRDPDDGQYFTGLGDWSRWLTPARCAIASWIDLNNTPITPEPVASEELAAVKLSRRISSLDMPAYDKRSSVLWPANECSIVDWNDADSVAGAVHTAYTRCAALADEIAEAALALDRVSLTKILSEAGRLAGTTTGPYDADHYAALVARYWADME